MNCHRCKRPASGLIRGVCPVCAPNLHILHRAALVEMGRRMDRYKADTGQEALDDWEAFEAWEDA